MRPLADALRSASTVEEIANALVSFGLPALNACVCVLALLSEDESEFFCPCIVGYPGVVANAWRRFPADAHLPISKAVRDSKSILLETLERRQAYYLPDTQLPPPVGRALAAIPLRLGEVTGALGFTFPDDRSFEEGERDALKVAAALCAEALVRVRRSGLGYEVLVVDDEPGILKMLDFALRYHAFTIRGAASGKEAIEVYQQHKKTVEVVLLDVQMPEMDGPKTLAALREINPEIGCVFMSGSTGRYSSQELLAVGGVRVLQKPFSSLDEVIQALRGMVHR